MKKTHLSTLLMLFAGVFLSAQTTTNTTFLGTSAQHAKTQSIQLSWSVGEPFVQTVSVASMQLTEGVQQANLRIKRITPESPNFQVKLFPNPTDGKVNIHLEEGLEENIKIQVFNANGNLVQNLEGVSKTSILDIANFPSGLYFVKVIQANDFQTFSIIKN